jgi:transposase
MISRALSELRQHEVASEPVDSTNQGQSADGSQSGSNFGPPGGTSEYPHGINTGMSHTRDLTDEQWKTFDPIIPKSRKRRDRRGRPWKSRRSVLNGVLWVLRTGAPWADLPDRYPSFQTCHRRFQQWVRSGVMTRIMTALARELSRRGAIDVHEAFIDASFAPAKTGGHKVGKTKRGKGTKIMAVADRNGLPVSVCAESADYRLQRGLLRVRSSSRLTSRSTRSLCVHGSGALSCWPMVGKTRSNLVTSCLPMICPQLT